MLAALYAIQRSLGRSSLRTDLFYRFIAIFFALLYRTQHDLKPALPISIDMADQINWTETIDRLPEWPQLR